MCLWQNRKRKFPTFSPRVLNACQQLFGTYHLWSFLISPSEGEDCACWHSLASDTGEPGWPHLEDGRVLGLLEVLRACPWNPALPRLQIVFQHSLMQQGLKSHHCCSSKITFQLPARGRAKPVRHGSSFHAAPQHTVQDNSSSPAQCPPPRNGIKGIARCIGSLSAHLWACKNRILEDRVSKWQVVFVVTARNSSQV